MNNTSPFMTPKQVAEYVHMSTSALAKIRVTGGGPPYVKFGRRVLYRKSDLDAYIEVRVRRSTTDDGP